MIDLSIVIVSYKTRELLDSCLASVFAADLPFSFKVVVVDNASGDGTAEMVRGKYPRVELVESGSNVGFSAGNNLGIPVVQSRHLLLLNPDTEVISGDTLTSMMRFLDTYPHVGFLGCQLLNTDGSNQDSWFTFPLPFSKSYDKFAFYGPLVRRALGIGKLRPLINHPGARRVDIVKGACFMVRREAADGIGALDENSFLYADDTDWSIRAYKAGWEGYSLTDKTLLHHGYASTDQEPYITITSSRRSALYLHRKHYPAFFTAVWAVLIFLEVFYKYLRAARWARKKPDEANLARFRAYSDLLMYVFRGDRRKK
jgi:GT2 family glycosyltransferase